MSSHIPRIIWAIWLDFGNKRDGTLEEGSDMAYLATRIAQLHQEWEVNIITKWSELEGILRSSKSDEAKSVLALLDNQYVGAAHKSDFIRFYLLNTYGGFWLDISTFLLCPLDVYLTSKPTATFIGMYTPPFMIAEIIWGPLSDIQDSVKFSSLLEKFKERQEEYISLREAYQTYPFIPENFFIASIPGHGIINKVFAELKVFWSSVLDKLTSENITCNMLNYLMHKLVQKVFHIKDINYEIAEAFTMKDYTETEYGAKKLKSLYNCSYIFNYLQMYVALVDYMKEHRGEYRTERVTNVSAPDEFKEINICYDREGMFRDAECSAVVVSTDDNRDDVYLHPLSWSRMIKWGDTMQERVSFDNTYIKKALVSASTAGEARDRMSRLISIGIYQIKFSSWTRSKNTVLGLLQKYFPNELEGQGVGGGRAGRRLQQKQKQMQKQKRVKRGKRLVQYE